MKQAVAKTCECLGARHGVYKTALEEISVIMKTVASKKECLEAMDL